jgi:hypothetical protein
MPCHLAVQSRWRIPVDHLFGSAAVIDLMMVVVQDSGAQFVGPDGQRGREAVAARCSASAELENGRPPGRPETVFMSESVVMLKLRIR